MVKIGDIVIYHQDKGYPTRTGVACHPAIVTHIQDGRLDLTVFWHNSNPYSVSAVEFGDSNTEIEHWGEA